MGGSTVLVYTQPADSLCNANLGISRLSYNDPETVRQTDSTTSDDKKHARKQLTTRRVPLVLTTTTDLTDTASVSESILVFQLAPTHSRIENVQKGQQRREKV